ncbi:MAG: sodium-dependent transporter [Planctomycetes bacterium]|nr:sodium-dependent transporter [Planctomycetota bacterium]
MTNQPKQQWGSRLGVILAVSGSAVGLGNFLRFPGNAAENGGGAFMIPYFLALLLLGIPIGWAEWTMGRYGGQKGFHSAPAILGVWSKGGVGRYLGGLGVLIPLGVYFWYVLVETWCLYYVIEYFNPFTNGIGIDPTAPIEEQVKVTHAFFETVTGAKDNGILFSQPTLPDGSGGGVHKIVWTFFLVAALNIFFVFRGLSKGIEAVCKAAMPIMAVLGIVILVRVLTLGTPDPAKPEQSVLHGLGYLWNPQLEALGNFKTWLAAAGQIFFSLSVGFGVIINYSSYMKKKDDVVLSGLTASATNEFFEVALGGLITVTASIVFVGVAVTQQGTGGTMSLGFKTLPMVFAQMPGGNFFGGAFFLILFLAAITSSLSMLQPTKAFIEESLGCDRTKSTLIVTAWGLIGNFFVLWYSKNLIALDTIDFWVGTFFILVVAGVQIVAFGWIFGVDKGIEEAHRGANMRIPKVFAFVMKYVSPLFLGIVVVGFCINNVPDYLATLFGDGESAGDARLTWLLILATLGGITALTVIGQKRWRAEGLDLDGRDPLDD